MINVYDVNVQMGKTVVLCVPDNSTLCHIFQWLLASRLGFTNQTVDKKPKL